MNAYKSDIRWLVSAYAFFIAGVVVFLWGAAR